MIQRFFFQYSLFLPACVNHLFNIFSVRLQTLSYIIILSIPFNAFNHRSKISISGLNCSRYIICKYIEVLVTRKIVHTLNARRTQLTCVFRKKKKRNVNMKMFLISAFSKKQLNRSSLQLSILFFTYPLPKYFCF